jgi:hypothetical protein
MRNTAGDTECDNWLRQAASALEGKLCWEVSTPLGSSFSLHFGRAIYQQKIFPLPLQKSKAGLEQREIDQFMTRGQLSLDIAGASWRLDGPRGIVTWWGEQDTTVGGRMEEAIGRLQGRYVQRALVEAPGWDLRVDFTDGYSLKVFCDDVAEGDNYTLFHYPYWISVEAWGRIEVTEP